MRLTRKGWLFLLAGVGLAGLGMVLRAPAATGAGCLLLIAVGVALNSVADVQLAGTRTLARNRMEEGEPLRVSLTIQNGSKRSRHVEIRDHLPRQAKLLEGSNYQVLTVPGGGDVAHEMSVTFVTRGSHAIGALSARLQDPLGLVTEERTLAGQTNVLVEPRIERLKTVPLRSRLARTNLGAHITRRSGDGFEFYAIRPYNPGDSPKHVNWKASARSSELLVNQRSHESYAEITFLVDVRRATDVGVERYTPMEQGARATASLAAYFLTQRDVVRLHLYGDGVKTVQPSSPGHQLRAIKEELALVEPEGRTGLHEVIEQVRPTMLPRSPVVVVSSFDEDPRAPDALKRLIAAEHNVLVVSPRPEGLDAETDVREALEVWRRQRTIDKVRGYGAQVLDWRAGKPLNSSIMGGLQ